MSTWADDRSVTGDIDVPDVDECACFQARVAQVELPPRADVLMIRFPLCMDAWL